MTCRIVVEQCGLDKTVQQSEFSVLVDNSMSEKLMGTATMVNYKIKGGLAILTGSHTPFTIMAFFLL